MKKRDFVSITDIFEQEFWQILELAKRIKSKPELFFNRLKNKTLVMIFEKPSLRSRLSFEIGMTQLGGHAVYLAPADIGMGKREPVSDVAKVVSGMCDIIMARTFTHETVTELAKFSSVPVINGLSDLEHPCQILADYLTVLEKKKKLKGLTVTYVGDCENNVTHSLALGAAMLKMNFRCASPKGYEMEPEIMRQAKKIAKGKTEISQMIDPKLAIRNSDVVITDTWVSMGDEAEKAERIRILRPYQVNSSLMKLAKEDAIFLHCLPAYRGNEVTVEVIDGPQSVVFDEAENRLYTQKALILFLLGATI